MHTFTLRDATLRDRDGLWDVSVVDGRVAAVAPADVLAAVGVVHDLGGRLLLPGMVDVHVHLDKAFQSPYVESLTGGSKDIGDALRSTAAVRGLMPAGAVEANADRVVRMMVQGGTVAARAHVEVHADSDLGVVRMHRDIAEAHPEIVIELSAFAQYGTTGDPRALVRMERALADGCAVVAGCPYADPDPIGHLDEVIALAQAYDAPLDLHLDLSDDPDDLLLGAVVPRVERAGLQGKVVVGHVTALTAASPDRVRELAAAVAGAGITVVAIPTTDLFLSGRNDASAPTRGVTRIEELLAAGVPVALASNNYENAFTPVSMPSLTHAAWLASLTNYMGTTSQQLALLDAITTVPRSVLGCDVPGLAVGDVIGGSVFDVAEPVDVVRSAARPAAVVSGHRGVVVPPSLGAAPSLKEAVHGG